MFTLNYQNYMYNMFVGLGTANNYVENLWGKDYVGLDGATVKAYTGSASFVSSAGFGKAMLYPRFKAISGMGIYFGTGPTPAKVDDVTLESPITGGLEKVHSAVSFVKEVDGRYSVCGQYTLKNTSGEPINIYEIGVVVDIYTSSSEKKPVLMERSVLSVPITIGYNETKTVTYKLTFNQALNVE